MVSRIELALDRAEAAIITELGDQIDASIGLISPVRFGPFPECPSILILLSHLGIMLEELDAEPLEVCAFLTLGLSPSAVAFKQITNRTGHTFSSLRTPWI
ncbi:hypothetical protein ASE85_21650 [Sphingobium sp. Leaf26]|uniref:hypothetical protein n=1 Tax=Sphingobium sp. Leaf26 TaxID=1735693 RepID=UPI0006FECAE3|nr:hypothetical protein [Sphingobium sp. Leaf26]KQN01801.1 hypothetical protein ASE85_21650 [Sphingobium sp. Leaf26]